MLHWPSSLGFGWSSRSLHLLLLLLLPLCEMNDQKTLLGQFWLKAGPYHVEEFVYITEMLHWPISLGFGWSNRSLHLLCEINDQKTLLGQFLSLPVWNERDLSQFLLCKRLTIFCMKQ